MIHGIISGHNLATQSILVSLSSQFPSQTINMNSSRSKVVRLCMLRGDPDESTDQYYQKMIKHNPGNALLLGNYARYLKEVRGDFAKAEQYCARAILTKAEDGNVLSLYGELVWQINKNAKRAEGYFHQAVLSHPDDRYSVKEAVEREIIQYVNRYILAAYARFLWDAEEKDEDK